MNFVDVDDMFVLKDSMNSIALYHVLDSAHADSDLLIYFPAVRVLGPDADLYSRTTGEQSTTVILKVMRRSSTAWW